MAFVRKVKVENNYYWQVRMGIRISDRDKPKQVYLDYLGAEDLAYKGKCPKCDSEDKMIYPKYHMCEDCITDLPVIKEKIESRKEEFKG